MPSETEADDHDPFLFKVDSKDILPPPKGKQFFNVDKEALTIVRTPSEVLAIVYGNSSTGTTEGGFFPDEVNGTITTVYQSLGEEYFRYRYPEG